MKRTRRKYENYDPRAPRPHAMGPRPHVWVTGPDPVLHAKYRAFIQHKNQSNFRNEPWTLTFEEYCELWTDDLWPLRGRRKEQLCLTRTDWTGPWSRENVEIIDRRTHNHRQIQRGRRPRGPNRQREVSHV